MAGSRVHVESQVVCREPLKYKARIWRVRDVHKQSERETQVACFDSGEWGPIAFASTEHNEYLSLRTRACVDTVAPDLAELGKCLAWAKQNHNRLLPRVGKIVSVSFEEYLSRSNATPQVKRVLQETHQRLTELGITEDSVLTRAQRYAWTTRKSFVKVENLLYRTPFGMKQKAPRLIQGAQPEFIVLVGPWIMAFQDMFSRRWNTRFFLTYTGGRSVRECAAVLEGDGEYGEDDMALYDASQHEMWGRYECWVSKRHGAPRAVLALMEANLRTHGATNNGWRYRVRGTRKSGDPYTTLFNTWNNGIGHAYWYSVHHNVSVREMQTMLKMLLMGDDNAMRGCGVHAIPWREYMAKLGLDSEFLPRKSLYDVEFCSSRVVPSTVGPVFAPKAGRVLAKFGYFVQPARNAMGQLKGVALGLRDVVRPIPPLRALVESVLGKLEYVEPERVKIEEWKMAPSNAEATSDTMWQLCRTYGWSYELQCHWETDLSHMCFGDELPQYLLPLLETDTSGPKQWKWS